MHLPRIPLGLWLFGQVLLVDAAQQCRLALHTQLISVLPTGTSSAETDAPTGTGTATAAPSVSATPFAYGSTPIRGVNLGGWLVLEPWITPSIFNNTNNDNIVDEYTFGQMQDAQTAQSALQAHWSTWITEDDFSAIAAAGLNHVRIPVGYWSVPLESSETNGSTSTAPYTTGAWPYLLQALNWARQYDVHVIIDLHGAPGSQNGFDNSGQRTSNPEWFNNSANMTRTIDTLCFIVENIGGMIDVIELLNEPAAFLASDYPSVLRQFWQDGYTVVRDAVGKGIQVMIGDGFQGVADWTNFLTYPDATNVIMDWVGYSHCLATLPLKFLPQHEYQIFSVPELQRTFAEHIAFTCSSISSLTTFAASNIWTIVGEWSTAPTDCAVSLNGRGHVTSFFFSSETSRALAGTVKTDHEYSVGARWDGTWYTPNTPLGSCAGWTGSYTTFSSNYTTFLRQYWEVQTLMGESVQGWIYWTWKVGIERISLDMTLKSSRRRWQMNGATRKGSKEAGYLT
ncbi:Glycoside hydrolase family 5 protein [Mycena chlorophos]|uniref:Glycoside hydrolase family 5 protein n=1 Tax=Mycena chlorophos TaxID=658473 RepID=A0A8H6THK0_MYCCL|nr:Glycoside hydrolase family 5 protein [Mycena chlorophos]